MNATSTDGLTTVRDLLRLAVTRMGRAQVFFGHGQADAVDEAAQLVGAALKLPHERLDLFLDARLTTPEIDSLYQLIERRVVDRLPVAYLVGEAWLQGYRFRSDPRAIIPRSFIAELLKDGLLPWIDDATEVTDVLDLCTGSGCLAVIAADAFPQAQVDAVDLSADALALAAENVAEHDLAARVHLHRGDLFSPLGGRQYDLILSNPPYVPEATMQRLPPEYLHEPRMALAADDDGMDIVRRLLQQARAHLKPGGLLLVEIGGERHTVEAQFGDLPFTWLATSGGDDMVFLLRREDLV
ncbi:MAG: 50S ribosomal protein L3 N(5)-glutamine methyltransferase [Betaproteobacteria bacterium]